MDRTRSAENAVESREPIRVITSTQEDEELILSPERIMQGVSMTTEVLVEILARKEQNHQLRHFGINE